MTKWLKEIKKKFGVRVIKVKIASTTLQKAEKSTHNLLPTIQAKTFKILMSLCLKTKDLKIRWFPRHLVT